MSVQPIPDGFNSVSGYLIVKGVKEALDFYAKAFGAETGMVMDAPDGSILHAEIRIGNSTVMLSEENPQWNLQGPLTLGGVSGSLHIYTEDADAAYQQAIDAGCTELAPLMDAFWGDRYGKVADPFGHHWGIATHKEDLTPEQLEQRAAEFFASMAGN